MHPTSAILQRRDQIYRRNLRAEIESRVSKFDRKIDDPQRRAAYAACSRARRRGMEFDLDFLASLPCPSHCPVFGTPITFGEKSAKPMYRATFDRIDSTLGYVSGNVCIISHLANMMKSSATAEQLRQFANWILEK